MQSLKDNQKYDNGLLTFKSTKTCQNPNTNTTQQRIFAQNKYY